MTRSTQGRLQLKAWARELVAQAFLTTAVLAVAAEYSGGFRIPHSFDVRDLMELILRLPLVVLFVFIMSGYAVTSVIARMGVPLRRWWVYPLVLAGLYLLHFAVAVRFLSGEVSAVHVKIGLAGALGAFGCGALGSRALRSWMRMSGIGSRG